MAVRARGVRRLVVALRGPLGAGKTAFVQGLAAGLGAPPESITSPTFVIAAETETPAGRLVHVDWYRLEGEGELEAAGLRDWLAGGVLAVEWADRFPGALPAERLDIALVPTDDPGARGIEVEAAGAEARALLAAWRPSAPAPGPGAGRAHAAEESGTWR